MNRTQLIDFVRGLRTQKLARQDTKWRQEEAGKAGSAYEQALKDWEGQAKTYQEGMAGYEKQMGDWSAGVQQQSQQYASDVEQFPSRKERYDRTVQLFTQMYGPPPDAIKQLVGGGEGEAAPQTPSVTNMPQGPIVPMATAADLQASAAKGSQTPQSPIPPAAKPGGTAASGSGGSTLGGLLAPPERWGGDQGQGGQGQTQTGGIWDQQTMDMFKMATGGFEYGSPPTMPSQPTFAPQPTQPVLTPPGDVPSFELNLGESPYTDALAQATRVLPAKGNAQDKYAAALAYQQQQPQWWQR